MAVTCPTYRPALEGFVSNSETALLVFSAAATGAWVVAPRLGKRLCFRSLELLHQLLRRMPGIPQRRHLGGVGAAVGKKTPIAGAEVIQVRFVVSGLDDAIFRATPVAHGADIAFPTTARQRLLFGFSEGFLCRAFEEFQKRGFTDVAQAVLRGDEVISHVKVAVVFDDRDIPADRPKDTQRMVQTVGRSGSLLEDLHDDPPDVLMNPFVKNGAEEGAEGFRRYGAGAHAAPGGRLRLDEGNEAKILGLDLLEEAVDVEGVLDVLRMDNTEKIDGELMLPQQAITLHHLPVCGLLVFGHAIGVVQRRRTVDAEADDKIFSGQKAAPVVIQENAVRLDGVGDAPAVGPVLALEFHDAAKIIQSENGRFTAVPGEIDLRFKGNLDLLDDVCLQQVVSHSKRLGLGI